MDSKEAKILVLEKIFYDILPEIHKHFLFFQENEKSEVNISVETWESGYGNVHTTIHSEMLCENVFSCIALYKSTTATEEYKTIEEAIKSISNLLKLEIILNLAKDSKKILSIAQENYSELLKEILGYSNNIDIFNLNTRKVLIEKIN